ncbi:hypothetical protein [Dankookia sp. P2]|uniref:hypothetical protein n=1 Tax=Dankookia sp. P2 TaxID=3423955 RepID=UPI003D6654DA
MTDRVTQVPPQDVKADLLPQAVVRSSLEHFAAHRGIDLSRGTDDLDGYRAAFLRLRQVRAEIPAFPAHRAGPSFAAGLRIAAPQPEAEEVPLLVMLQRYDGEPADQFSIFLPAELHEAWQVDAALHRVLEVLHIPEQDLAWRRQPEDPR